MPTVCITAGVLAAIMVYVGDAFHWPHLNRRAGFFGTDFISGVLYAIGDPYAIHVVALLWFSYTVGIVLTLIFFCRRLYPQL